MALFEILPDEFREIDRRSFAELKLRERGDLQRLLRRQIEVLDSDLYVITEEFGDWEDSRRRIDLLAIDKEANLVVIELKRTHDGGHMELQAVRYAAMVSTMTFEKVVDVHRDYLRRQGEAADDAEAKLLGFLEWSEPDDDFGKDVRIILVSADFGIELTTAVLWLRERGIDIRCVRLRPYANGNQMLLDVQQIIPLPEVEDYMVRLREKKEESRAVSKAGRDFTRYRVTVDGVVHENLPKNRAILTVVKAMHARGAPPVVMRKTMNQGARRFYQVEGLIESGDEFIEAAADAAPDNEGREFKARRYFTDDEDLLRFEGKTYVFSNQWGPRTEAKMKELIDAHGKGVVGFERIPG